MKKIKLSIHGLMIAFSLGSYANVQSFIYDIHPNLLLSNAIGVSIGLALVITSIMLSTMTSRDRNFFMVLVVTVSFAVLSAGIQTASYVNDSVTLFWAIPMGSAPPIIGECLLAIALSAYIKSKKAESITNSQDVVAEGIREQIAYSVSNIDKKQIQEQVNFASQRITEVVIQKTINDVIEEIGVVEVLNEIEDWSETVNIFTEKINDFERLSKDFNRIIAEHYKLLDIANPDENRKGEKRRQILDYITSNPGIKNKDVAELFQVTPSYISQLKNM